MSLLKFDECFIKIYGERWDSLKESLMNSELQVARKNKWYFEGRQKNDIQDELLRRDSRLFDCDPRSSIQQPERNEDALLSHYIMDPASVLAARSLPIQAGDRILDMCAAPGGKSLILAEQIAEAGELICNDLSPDRRERLKKVIQQYIPRSVRDRVWIKGQDAVNYGLREKELYDSILLDAPCSGERHFLENSTSKEMEEWSEKRSERLAARQYSLLCAALLAVKSGGHILYSTCSINPNENDSIIAKLKKKKKNQFELSTLPSSSLVEVTDFGNIVLPDRNRMGPIYFTLLRKL